MTMALRTKVFQLLSLQSQAGYATSTAIVQKFDWKAVKVPDATAKDIPTSVGGAAFPGDIRATSGLGRGDGLKDHTSKWLQVRPLPLYRKTSRGEGIQRYGQCGSTSTGFRPSQGSTKSPLEYIREAEPIKVEGPVVASRGSEQPLGGGGISHASLRSCMVWQFLTFCPMRLLS